MADTAAVRRWAREQGYPVGDRGRLSPDLVRAYDAAHDGEPAQPAAANRPRRSSSRSGSSASSGSSRQGRGSSTAVQARTVHARSPWDWPRRGE